jgi:hypothetical protein
MRESYLGLEPMMTASVMKSFTAKITRTPCFVSLPMVPGTNERILRLNTALIREPTAPRGLVLWGTFAFRATPCEGVVCREGELGAPSNRSGE